MLPALLARLANLGGEPFEIGGRERGVGHLEQGDDGALGRPVEERLEQMIQRRSARSVARNGGEIHVAGSVLAVPEVSLLLEHVHRGADGRVARRVRQLGDDVGDRRFAVAVQDVHDLPLAPGELGGGRGGAGPGRRGRRMRHRLSVLGKQQCAAYLAVITDRVNAGFQPTSVSERDSLALSQRDGRDSRRYFEQRWAIATSGSVPLITVPKPGFPGADFWKTRLAASS